MIGPGSTARTAVPPNRVGTHRCRGRFPVGWAARVVAGVLLLLLAWLRLGWEPALVSAGYLAAVTGPLIGLDVAEHRLPNRLVLPGYAFALAALALAWAGGTGSPGVALAAGGACFLGFLLMNLAGGMGMGDVKLAGVLGLSLGLIGAGSAIAGIVLAFLFGGVAGAFAMLAGRGGPRTRIPFGPFLLAGYWASVALTPVLAPAF